MKKYALILAVAGALFGAPSAFASIVTYDATLSGASESPSNVSPGTGFASITWDSVLHTMAVHVTFSGLIGTVTAAHVHCCTAVANTGNVGVLTGMTGFPSGVTSGTHDELFDLTSTSSFSAAFVTASGGTLASAESAFFIGMDVEKAYFNIHTTQFPGGEIRGFFVQQVPDSQTVPEPGSLVLLGVGLAGLGFSRRKKSRILCLTFHSVS